MDLVKQLPQDIVIHHIFPRLDYTSWVRAAGVCRAWRDLSLQLVPPPPDIPWMWLSDKQYNHFFLSFPSTPTSPLLPCPLEVRIGSTIASCRQYLLICPPPLGPPPRTPRNALIYNPFTGDAFSLPPLPPRRTWKFRCGALSCLPSCSGSKSCVFVAAIVNFVGAVHICRLGDRKWARAFNMGVYNNLIFHRGLLYSINIHRRIMAMDVVNQAALPPRVVVPAKQYTHLSRSLQRNYPFTFTYFLVESCHGELLVVTRYYLTRRCLRLPIFTVHKVDEQAGKLMPVNDLGDQMLFVGHGGARSSWYRAHAWPSDFFSCNTIYFFNLDERLVNGQSQYSFGKFSLQTEENGSRNSAVFHRDQLLSSFLPLWITPVPT